MANKNIKYEPNWFFTIQIGLDDVEHLRMVRGKKYHLPVDVKGLINEGYNNYISEMSHGANDWKDNHADPDHWHDFLEKIGLEGPE